MATEQKKPLGYGEAEEKLLLFLPSSMKSFLRQEAARRQEAGEGRCNMNVLIREAVAEKYPNWNGKEG